MAHEANKRVLHAVPAEPVKAAPRNRRKNDVVSQVRAALAPRARLATGIGAVLGGFVPAATWQVSHHELTSAPIWTQYAVLLVLGGLAYSAITVYRWGRLAFRSPVKAVGFCILLEGVLIGSRTPWLSAAALVLLAGINGIATGATLSNEESR